MISTFYARPIALLKDYLVQLRTYHALKSSSVLRSNIPYQQARSVGVLFDIEGASGTEAMKELVLLLEQNGKAVTALALVGLKNKEKGVIPAFPFDFFTARDVSYWGQINAPHVRRFVNTPFDYLYCVSKTSSVLIYYLLAQSKALCRVGEHKAQNSIFFEMMIDAPSSTSSLVQAMCAYTKKIR